MPPSWSLHRNSGRQAWVNVLAGRYSVWRATHRCWEEDISLRTMEASHTPPCAPLLWLVLVCILLLHENYNHKHSAFLSFVSYPGELSNLRVVVGNPESVASWSDVRTVLGPLNLRLVSEVKGGVWGLFPQTVRIGKLLAIFQSIFYSALKEK